MKLGNEGDQGNEGTVENKVDLDTLTDAFDKKKIKIDKESPMILNRLLKILRDNNMDVQVVMQYTEQFSDMEILDDNFVDEFEESIRENEESDTDMDQDDCNEQLIAAGVLQEFVDKKNEKEEDGKEKGGKGKGRKGKDKKGKGGKGKNKKGKGISGKKARKINRRSFFYWFFYTYVIEKIISKYNRSLKRSIY